MREIVMPRLSHIARSSSSARETQLRMGIIDRDTALVFMVVKCIEELGWEHELLPESIPAETLAGLALDALIVDLAIVVGRRWQWLRSVCDQRPDLGIVVCTPTSTVTQRVLSLRMGVDDWLGKPCHPEELIARVEAVTAHRLRRRTGKTEPTMVGEVELRPERYQAFVAGRSLGLTPREYQLIELLSRSSNIHERESIYEALWGKEMARNGRSVDVCVHKLRRKLELASPHWRYIETQYGAGYRLAPKRIGAGVSLALDPDDADAASLAA
jgi:DNA-binding response OmpR family regulator